MASLAWLPEIAAWRPALNAVAATDDWFDKLVALAQHRLDFVRINALDTLLQSRLHAADAVRPPQAKPIRLAILGSSTLAHLKPAIRIAAVRRGLLVTIYEADYGQYWQELTDPASGLHAFKPTMILFALDAHHLAAGVTAAMREPEAAAALDEVQNRVRECWRLARETWRCPVIHQTPLPVHPAVLGSNEHRLPGSKAGFIARFNAALRPMGDAACVDLLAIDDRAARDGLAAWHDAGLWHRAKQEISPAAAPLYGDLVGRLIAAKQGKSYKCLVMDLDNTVWGGVVGDDGLEGIVIGQGSALGEAFVAFQEYARELSRRGIILAVCSKNDAANALEPFDRHPEMVLRRGDIACFVANWTDKAANIRAIAAELNIGLDSLVFVDDNPFERSLVRQELPMVAVPEVGDDPVHYARILAEAGYFEGVAVTREDRERTGQYQGNRMREALKSSATDLASYLRGLQMQLIWRRFDPVGLARTVQLINKTNQFNLTTRRYSEEDVLGVMRDNRAFGLQLRLLDRFGDNGIVSIVIGRMQPASADDSGRDGPGHDGPGRDDDDAEAGDLLIDTWLMSCRVLGRQVEPTTLNLVAEQAKRLGARRLVGEYVPTSKNAMVRDHYVRLGFTVMHVAEDGASRAALDLGSFIPAETFIEVREG
jgi:FkbH-like protein